jgi:hypothetical protein
VDREVAGLLQGLLVLTGMGLIAYSPIARAIGNRILHGKLPAPGVRPFDEERLDQISGEMAAMRQHLDETLDRLEFTERMLAQAKDREALPGSR